VVALNVVATFERILSEMLADPGRRISTLNCLSERDYAQICLWNNEQRPSYEEHLVHRLFEQVALLAPNAAAVCSWDGDATYEQLDVLSSTLAKRLVERGVEPGHYVPVCFEKSIWAVVAALGVLKAGAAFVPLDPAHPKARILDILHRVGAHAVVASLLHAPMFTSLVRLVVVVSASDSPPDDWNDLVRCSSPTVTPRDSAFILFTSGSTGIPKGIVHEHRSVASNALGHGRSMRYGRDSRVLQFASHTFDVAQMDFWTTLLHGGCICIPEEEDRRYNIINVVETMKVNWALLTPSFASLIHPDQVPSLQTLVLGGETLPKEAVSKWADKVVLINCYGPAECGACLTLVVTPGTGRAPNNVGYALPNSVCWLAEPENHDRLVPIGAVGELLVEGPNLARGYLNDPSKTESAFISSPSWASGSRPRRFYKTGDLLRYNLDGSMDFIGRKDDQVKLRGQRVELGEVEHHLSTIPEVSVSVVAAPRAGCYTGELVAVVQLENEQPHAIHGTSLVVQPDCSFGIQHIKAHLDNCLPSYMVPTVCFVVQSLPFNTSLKVDRRAVTSWLEQMAERQDERNGQDGPKMNGSQNLPATNNEDAFALSCEVARIAASQGVKSSGTLRGRDFALHSLGLDSIQVISLAMFVQGKFQIKLPMSILLDASVTINSLGEFIRQARQGGMGPNLQNRFSIGKKVRLLSAQLTEWASANDHGTIVAERTVYNVLLTGCTGYLGKGILRRLLEHSQQSVILLVRSSSADSGLERVVGDVQIQSWWKDCYYPRTEVWPGDLARPQLGLTEKQWQRLCGQGRHEDAIHAIIHNGAKVHWSSPYSTLEPANVGSTLELLKAASGSPFLANFTYVSGGRLPADEEVSGQANADPAKLEPNSNGYRKSKVVSELLVRRFAQLRAINGVQVSIIRPGYIIGHANDGAANRSDFLWRLVAVCVDVKAFPRPDTDTWLYVSDVETVARLTVSTTEQVVKAPTENAAVLMVRIHAGLPLSSFWAILLQVGYRLDALPFDEWMARVHDHVSGIGQQHPFFPLLRVFEADGEDEEASAVEDPGSEDRDMDVEASGQVEEAVRRNVEHLIEMGFLAALRNEKLASTVHQP
ncbi:acetyl-CoA synthetase-like protein, partial [Byssothecium circinans]